MSEMEFINITVGILKEVLEDIPDEYIVRFEDDVSSYPIKDYEVDAYVRVKRDSDKPIAPATSGCGGNVATTSIVLSSLAGLLAIAIILSKKRKLGGKE